MNSLLKVTVRPQTVRAAFWRQRAVRFSSSSAPDAPESKSEKQDQQMISEAVRPQRTQQGESEVREQTPLGDSVGLRRTDFSSIPRVPNTANIDKNDLYLDMLFSNYRPLLQPIRENHTRGNAGVASTGYEGSAGGSGARSEGRSPAVYSPFSRMQPDPVLAPTRSLRPAPRGPPRPKKKASNSIFDDLKEYKRIKHENKPAHYNPWFSKARKFTPIFTVFTNTVLNTEQHDLELFNLPLRVVENLRPFQVTNLPGKELFRDDLIYTRRLEIEEKRLKQRLINKKRYKDDLKLAKQGKKRLEIDDAGEFFGFK